MNIVIAVDSFKGSISSIAAGNAVARGVRRALPSAKTSVYPLADGGEGTVDALVAGLGGRLRTVRVTGPCGNPVEAAYGLLPGGTAVLEMAAAAGLTLVPPAMRDPRTTTTYGVGELLRDAVANGASRFILGIGGSATNDGGAGMLQALGWRLLDAQGAELAHGGAALAHLDRIVPPPKSALPDGVSIRVACDVTNPLCGPSGASAVFGPQKGASAETVELLDSALAHFARIACGDADTPGAGAAGGLGFALGTFLGAELVPGVDLVLSETGLADAIAKADLVVTGEGRLDGQTVMGKAPVGVARIAKRHGIPAIAFGGAVGDGAEALNENGVAAYFPVLRRVTTLAEAMHEQTAALNLEKTAEQVFRLWAAAQNGKQTT